MTDPYHAVYQGEIFQTSNCIWHENTVMDFVRSQLQSLGYHSINANHKVWQRGHQKVVVCLVDDFTTCSDQVNTAVPYRFDRNTVVITDNRVTAPTVYRVCELPDSFYGIYHHEPALQQWQPSRRFNFSVNRLDTKRMLVMLEIWCRAMFMALTDGLTIDDLDHVNFNCWTWTGNNSDQAGLQQNFTDQWQALESGYHTTYAHVYEDLINRMPLRNHDLTHEQSHVASWINVVMETYSSDTTIALSEKTFRALCLPVPWILYSGKHTVAYLQSMGFDVLTDLVPHVYDGMIENKTAAYGDKMVDFIFEGVDAVDRMRTQDFAEVAGRCTQAAKHNQQLLAQLRKQWPQDFAAWWPTVIRHIA